MALTQLQRLESTDPDSNHLHNFGGADSNRRVPVTFAQKTADGQHAIFVFDSLNPESTTLPDDVEHLEIEQATGFSRPIRSAEFRLIAISERLVNRFQVNPSKSGNTAYYRTRYVWSDGSTSPWSDLTFESI